MRELLLIWKSKIELAALGAIIIGAMSAVLPLITPHLSFLIIGFLLVPISLAMVLFAAFLGVVATFFPPSAQVVSDTGTPKTMTHMSRAQEILQKSGTFAIIIGPIAFATGFLSGIDTGVPSYHVMYIGAALTLYGIPALVGAFIASTWDTSSENKNSPVRNS